MTPEESDRIYASLPKCPKCGQTMAKPAPECFYCLRGMGAPVEHGFRSIIDD